MSSSELEARLLAFLRSLELPRLREPSSTTPLIRSGILDSMGLARLAIWIEEEVGHPLEPGSFDLAAEWNTVGEIVAFIQQRH